MKRFFSLQLLATFTFILTVTAQPYDRSKFKPVQGLFSNRCKQYTETLKQLPRQAGYGIEIIDRQIYLSFNSFPDFKKIYDQASDGLAIEIFSQSQFACHQPPQAADTGYLLPPLYREQLKQRSRVNALNEVMVHCGELPEGYLKDEVECNLWVIQRKAVCADINLLRIARESWNLLDMGFYYDSTSYPTAGITNQLDRKELNFTIQFGRNEHRFAASEIRPLLDSLCLSDYQITTIWVEAYTSIEGSFELNKALQQRRITTLVDAIQAYQQEKIAYHYRSKENWPAFADAIQYTPYAWLKRLGKQQVKDTLAADGALLQALEPYLAQHRLGKVRIMMERRLTTKTYSTAELLSFFEQALTAEEAERALALQHFIIRQVWDRKAPDSLLNQLDIPEISLYGPLFNNLFVVRSMLAKEGAQVSLDSLLVLRELFPNQPELIYNELVLRLRSWAEGNKHQLNRPLFLKKMLALRRAEFSESLLQRLSINFYLIDAQYHYMNKNYRERARAARIIRKLYRKAPLNDHDLLRLSRFLVWQQEYSMARELLGRELRKPKDKNEDMLFMFLTLVTHRLDLMQKTAIRSLFTEAREKNRARYCKLFNPIPQGGHSMQLLRDPQLKSDYCTYCQGQAVQR